MTGWGKSRENRAKIQELRGLVLDQLIRQYTHSTIHSITNWLFIHNSLIHSLALKRAYQLNNLKISCITDIAVVYLNMEQLTKAEERVMQVLWQIKKGFVKDIIAQLDEEPKPPYNTISSVVRQLEKKGYVQYKAYGKTYEYYPAMSKAAYRKQAFFKLFTDYFDQSAGNLLSFMVQEDSLSPDEVEEIKKMMNQK